MNNVITYLVQSAVTHDGALCGSTGYFLRKGHLLPHQPVLPVANTPAFPDHPSF